MRGLTFASPDWFWGLILLLPLIVLRIRSHWKMAAQLPGLVSPRLLDRLVKGESRSLRWAVFTLRCLALVAIIAALARPQSGFTEEETEIDARNLIIAIDTSRSMLADDTPPNRLTRAKLAAKDIVYSLPEDRIGLIAFAGRPFVQAPLTVDHEAVLEAIDQLDTDIIPRGGTNLSAAATLAMENFAEAGVAQSALVILSDGEAHEGLDEIEKVRARATELGMSILTVGVGTVEGSIIPETDANDVPIPGVFVKDENGQVVRTRLVAEGLQSLSSRDGAYVQLGGKASLTQVVNQVRSGISSSRESSDSRLRPIERFLWPLGAAILLILLGHILSLSRLWRRSPGALNPASVRRLTAMIGVTLFFSSFLAAKDESLIGHEAFAEKDYPGAIDAYERTLARKRTSDDRAHLQMGIGAAAYRMENFERAAEAYGEALVDGSDPLRPDAHYNLGNTLFRKGETGLTALRGSSDPDQIQSLVDPDKAVEGTIRDWEGSIEHFETALVLDPAHEMAAHNLEIVKKRLEQLKQEQEQQKKEEKKEEEEDKEDEKEEEDEKEKEPEQEDKEDTGDEDKEKSEENQDPEQSENDKPEEEKEEEGGENPGDDERNPGGENPGDPPQQDPPDDPGNDGKGDKPEPPDEPDPGKGDSPGQNPPGDPGGNEPQQPEAPAEGELEANPNQSQPPSDGSSSAASPAQKMTNPETGYSPSEARQLLESLADETEVRPVLQPSQSERFKNW